ncbi:toll/interleukin-1 receptor domain-containing protein [Pseudomonas sp. 21LCFQ010]|uniref:toll/interleukin-1 receptor domain-containing protein n=1 Tax=Pseudomonas sp. 21LCFQ010 TaxID=2957506 RepID=UPI002096F7AA|nr:toll/interleukin-1 receptor domain-containing protein [Pseudomonas sp. 21LCFQ010]MCO8160943.1 toll/interleukin-1 receptor domain-containing protein [Pseudomonas sp. 21LCFQ010]
MQIFISWSGSRSKAVAEITCEWIKGVLQATEPWISTQNVDRGSLWFTEIVGKLADVTVGIVCLTQDNKDKPWILFESGAMAKGLSGNRLCTLLVDLKPTDITDPLAQFNHSYPDRDGMFQLVKTLNSCLKDKSLPEKVLNQAFEVYWPSFESRFAQALTDNPPSEAAPKRTKDDILVEILQSTRELSHRIRALENDRKDSMSSMAVLSGPLRTEPLISSERKMLAMLKGVGATREQALSHMTEIGIELSRAQELAKNFPQLDPSQLI